LKDSACDKLKVLEELSSTLEELSLDFTFNEITDKGVESLCSTIFQLTNL